MLKTRASLRNSNVFEQDTSSAQNLHLHDQETYTIKRIPSLSSPTKRQMSNIGLP